MELYDGTNAEQPLVEHLLPGRVPRIKTSGFAIYGQMITTSAEVLPKRWFSKGNVLFQDTYRLVKYYKFARYIHVPFLGGFKASPVRAFCQTMGFNPPIVVGDR